ncbi:hypothetical protein D3C73_1084570 [compost metagenome]
MASLKKLNQTTSTMGQSMNAYISTTKTRCSHVAHGIMRIGLTRVAATAEFKGGALCKSCSLSARCRLGLKLLRLELFDSFG